MNTFIKSLILAVAAFAVANLNGCSFVPVTADMQYTPMAHAQHVQNAGTVTVRVTGGQEDRIIGYKKGGLGQRLASVKTSKPIKDVFATAVNKELISSGFNTSVDSPTVIAVDLSKYMEDTEVGFFAADYVSAADATISVIKNGMPIYSKKIEGSGKVTSVLISADAIVDSLNKATADALNQLFSDPNFIAAISNK